jgi:hypothetical protein
MVSAFSIDANSWLAFSRGERFAYSMAAVAPPCR